LALEAAECGFRHPWDLLNLRTEESWVSMRKRNNVRAGCLNAQKTRGPDVREQRAGLRFTRRTPAPETKTELKVHWRSGQAYMTDNRKGENEMAQTLHDAAKLETDTLKRNV
jgi:hypothetical protein